MISLAIVDDEQLISSSLATLLGLEEDLEVAGTFDSGESALAWWKERTAKDLAVPQVLVTDLQLGGADAMDGIELAVAVHNLMPSTAALVVTSHSRPLHLKRALNLGIAGFLPKTVSAADFATAIRTVHSGRRYIDPDLAAMTITASDSPLTEREAEVVEAAGQGGSIEDIARHVFLAPGTTRNYLSSAMAKLGAQNRYDVYLRAREEGWI
ncbi:response regulator transcription factor [Corynebacterium flavescens]|uniref:response regulator transcription factor n=1 Tax=Corynebacterium flavescens TaxID=28028 RepID=UPI002648003A|nr:response regulator transcription factor [Corynebacterium flavescens]MDN6200449.1 response regulator transcription factor [Corynebacterium flavescens]MDN6227535.1 response regulator transcription factor [Corynebacterium flavescens]